MKKYFYGLFFLVLVSAGSLSAREWDLTDPAFWNSSRIRSVTLDGGKALSIQGECWPKVRGMGEFAIDPGKTYHFSAEVRVRGKRPGILELGCDLADENKKDISYLTLGGMLYTDSVLAEPCKKGDTFIVVQSAAKWKPGGGSVAFNVPEGRRQEPWHDLAPGIRKITHKESCSVITLRIPLKRAYPAGTRVRQHQNASHFCFWRGKVKADGKWHTVRGTVSGIARNSNVKGKWWPTAKFAVLRGAFNVGASKDAVMEIRKIVFREESPSYF